MIRVWNTNRAPTSSDHIVIRNTFGGLTITLHVAFQHFFTLVGCGLLVVVIEKALPLIVWQATIGICMPTLKRRRIRFRFGRFHIKKRNQDPNPLLISDKQLLKSFLFFSSSCDRISATFGRQVDLNVQFYHDLF